MVEQCSSSEIEQRAVAEDHPGTILLDMGAQMIRTSELAECNFIFRSCQQCIGIANCREIEFSFLYIVIRLVVVTC